MPVDKRAGRILLPRPDVQRVERREAEAIGRLEQVQQLAHDLRRLAGVHRIPGAGEDQIIGADQAQALVNAMSIFVLGTEQEKPVAAMARPPGRALAKRPVLRRVGSNG